MTGFLYIFVKKCVRIGINLVASKYLLLRFKSKEPNYLFSALQELPNIDEAFFVLEILKLYRQFITRISYK